MPALVGQADMKTWPDALCNKLLLPLIASSTFQTSANTLYCLALGAGVCQADRAARVEGSPHGANSHAHQDLHQPEGLWLSRLCHSGHTRLILSEPPLIALTHL